MREIILEHGVVIGDAGDHVRKLDGLFNKNFLVLFLAEFEEVEGFLELGGGG